MNAAPDVGDEKDWRQHGAVTAVKDQGICGSCWSFGTTGAIEGQYFRKKNKLIKFSEQNLMDCSWSEGNHACDGGFDFQAYKWIIRNGGLQSTATYGPYMNMDAFCHYDPTRAAVMLRGFCNVTGIANLNHALTHVGPLSVSIDATQPSFYFYAGGYYTDANCKSGLDDLDHSVLAVGYTSHRGNKYTIVSAFILFVVGHFIKRCSFQVKNSWSTYWGDEGYIYIAQKDNICGVATAATYPQLV